MDQRTCITCEYGCIHNDKEFDDIWYYEVYCTKHKKQVDEDETCDDWEKE